MGRKKNYRRYKTVEKFEGKSWKEKLPLDFVMLDISPFGYASDVEFAHWMTREVGVAPVPGSSFFAGPENRYVRLNFAKRPATLHAAGERLLRLRRRVSRNLRYR